MFKIIVRGKSLNSETSENKVFTDINGWEEEQIFVKVMKQLLGDVERQKHHAISHELKKEFQDAKGG